MSEILGPTQENAFLPVSSHITFIISNGTLFVFAFYTNFLTSGLDTIPTTLDKTSELTFEGYFILKRFKNMECRYFQNKK